MKRICVFAGSSPGVRPAYAAAARELGAAIAGRGIGLVYGGASVGLMGELANSALTGGAEVTGVIPRPLANRELAHTGLTKIHVVESMHERKALMASLVDGFIALPGGYGTLEETFEVLTWSQLGIHRKPVGLLNVEGYYDRLIRFLEDSVREGLVKKEYFDLLLFAPRPGELLDAFAEWRPPRLSGPWLDDSQL